MKVRHFSCGPASNESELKAFEYLKHQLESMPGQSEWIMLTNLAFSITHQLQSDEIDIVLIGPPGVRVIEVKHWTAKWADSNKRLVEHEADRVTDKARKVGTTLRRIVNELPFVKGVFLLTQERSKVEKIAGSEVRGIQFHTLKDWKSAVNAESEPVLTKQQIETLSHKLEPRSDVAIDGSLRRLAGYINLELQTPKEHRFHRIYKGIHTARQDRVVLHLYDLSAGNQNKPEIKARREFETLHRLQLYPWAPRILDSFQEAPGYAGEMYFFTVLDPAIPSLQNRVNDISWNAKERLDFTLRTVQSLGKLHGAGSSEKPIVHRSLSTENILVKHDNSPILTGFQLAKISAATSIVSDVSTGERNSYFAPEVEAQGLGAADYRSDVYSVCACLNTLFEELDDEISQEVVKILARGLIENPATRATLEDIENSLASLLVEPTPSPSAPSALFWAEDQEVTFANRKYRIVSRLGSGGIGTAFKVVEINQSTKEDLGTYVAKVAHDPDTGGRILKSYDLARPYIARHVTFSAIFEVAREWQENGFVALMTWIEGSALDSFMGVFPLLAEDQQEDSAEALALRWLKTMCEALDLLHQNNLVHGDVSPRNMIVSGSDLVLTDYDFVTPIEEHVISPGTALYCPPFYEDQKASASNDIYALATSFFHIVFEKEPFRYNGTISKEQGLNWEGIDRTEYLVLADLLDKATHPNQEQRFKSVAEVLEVLKPLLSAETPIETETKKIQKPQSETVQISLREEDEQTKRSKNQVDWLLSLLQSYPGSKWGNSETRGLDTDFSRETYVSTDIERALYKDIINRKAKLVILCGNAGDGKTALLQSLAVRFGLGDQSSSERIIQQEMEDGLVVRMNLDGSAAWQGQSANEILDKFLEPFQGGEPSEDIAHLLAINDGRLLEWVAQTEDTSLTEDLAELLKSNTTSGKSYIRFIDLNQRSLVGDINSELKQIETNFLEDLLDKLYGGEKAATIWEPCQTCLAQNRCEVFRAKRLFGPAGLPGAESEEIRTHARMRLFEMLQAVHLRGETHVTVRELRAALVYILFGIHFCGDYHDNSDESILPYWDRSFSPDSPMRQGELLQELVRFDPALEAHPKIDRHLTNASSEYSEETTPSYPKLNRESARRRAYFEWTEQQIEEIGGKMHALDLAQGHHLYHFRDLPLKSIQELRDLCKRLCRGISQLEDLPPQALDRKDVPLRITPRTPTETAFWVEKPLDSFRLEADISNQVKELNQLHRQAFIIYTYRNGRKEKLRLGAELFHLLLELSDGYQLGDVSTDDTFAHLSIFVQRLVCEDERKLFAWNPIMEEDIHEISADIDMRPPKGNEPRQLIKINAIKQGASK